MVLKIKKVLVLAEMTEGPVSLPPFPDDFSSDGFRCKEQNNPAPAIKIFVVSNEKLPGDGPGCRLGESGL